MEEQIITKKERREIRRQEKETERVNIVRANKARKHLTRGFILLVFIAVVFGFWKLSQQTAPVGSPELLEINDTDWKRGDEDSQVVLMEYLDFQCPACGSYHPLVSQLFQEYGDRVQFVMRHFPLTSIHNNAMPAAKATEAAGRQGKFWEMHDVLFENQNRWSNIHNPEDTFVSYAEDIGLNGEQFLADFKDGSIDDKINSDVDNGEKVGVAGTPSFFLNGEKIGNPGGYEAFQALIESKLIQ